MAIIVDGYNVLHTAKWLASGWKGVGRAELCKLLGQLSQVTGEKVTVVFDAAPPKRGPGIGKELMAEVVFSGHGRKADDVIIKMINESSGPRDLTVVSSDREIRAAAKRRGCKVRPAGEFIQASARQLGSAMRDLAAEPEEKEKGLDPDASRQWLEEFGIDSPEDEDPYEGMRRG